MPDGRERRELDWLVAASPLVVLEAIGEAVIVTDPAESIVFWNSAAEAMFGWSAPEVAGRNVAEVMAPGATTSQAAVMMAWVRTDERWMGDIQAVHRDGRSVTARVTAAPVFTDDGSLVGIVGLLRDVTEMRGTTAELAISKRRFQALIQGSGDLFAITDAEGVITFLDGPVQSLLGVEANTLVGQSLFEVLQPGDLNRAHARWAQQVGTTTPMPPSDYWVRPGGGPWLCLNLLVSNLLDDPAVGGVVVTARDVTDHRHLEQARATMRGANIAIVHAASEDDLLGAICKVIVDETPYHVAWVGLSQPNLPLGARVVAFGDSPAYFDALERLAGKGTYRGPLFAALETHQVQVVHDVAALPETMPWRRLALDFGYRSAIALPLFFSEDDHGVLAIYSEDAGVFTDEAIDVLSELASDVGFGVEMLRARARRSTYRARFEASLEAVVRALATAAELRDPYTAGHQRRVAELAAAISTDLALDPSVTTGMRIAASIHDIGKLAVPSEILSRPGRISGPEFSIIKGHARAGHDILAGIDFPWPVAEMILQHHERLDGSGYPAGLRGEEISIGARILAVADTVEAMQSHRPYRPALGIEAALETIAAGRATLFDPDVVDACTRLFGEEGFHFTI